MTYHEILKASWCQWIGQRGTAKQIAKIRCDVPSLERMLIERGVNTILANGQTFVSNGVSFAAQGKDGQ